MSRTPGPAVARNAAFAAGRFLIAAVVVLWVTRFMLEVLGVAQFGVWALAGALLPVLRLLDLGLGRALTREVAGASGDGVPATAAPAMATSRGVALLTGVGVVLGVFVLRHLLVRLAAVPPELADVAAYVLAGTAVVAALEGAFAPFQAALDGLGRMDLTSSVDTFQRLASALGVVVVLGLGWGLPGLVWKNVLTALGAGLAYRRLLARHEPALARAAPRIERREARRLFLFGRHVQTVNLAALLVEPVTKTLLSRAAGLEAVALLELALRVTGQAGGAFLALATALFPAAAELRAERRATGDASAGGAENGAASGVGNGAAAVGRPETAEAPAGGRSANEALAALYRPAARYVALLALPAFGLLAVLAPAFVGVWLGDGYGAVADAMQVQSLGWLLAVLGLPAFLVAQAGGHERLSTVAGLVTAGVSLALALLLVPSLGLTGAVWSGALGLAAGGVVALLAFARRMELPPGAVSPASVRAWLAAGLAVLAAASAERALPPGLMGLVAAAGLGLATYGVTLVLLREVAWTEMGRLWAVLARTGKGAA